MIFSHADTKITWYPKNNLDWIYFEKMKNITWGKDGPQEQESVALHIRPEQSKNFIRENFAKNYEYKPEKVKISQDEKGKVVFEGEGKEGSQIEYNEIPKLVEAALIDETASPTIEVPVRKIPNEIEISENLQKQGIKDLLTTRSKFEECKYLLTH
jgi:ribosomal protein L23